MNNIKEDELLLGAEKMIDDILNIINEPSFKMSWLDNMEKINNSVLLHQDELFNKNGIYITLSMLFISFIDLGIIEP